MSFEPLIERLNEIAAELDKQVPDVALVQSFNELQADFLQRVFVDGEDSDNKKLGNYSTKESYYSRSKFIQQAKFKPQGKGGQTEFKTVTRPRKTMYIETGYKGLRDLQGRPVDKVNLDYTGSLKRAYRVFKFGNSVLFGQNDEMEHKKIKGLTDKYGEFQELTEQESQTLKNSIGENVKLIIAK